MHGNEYTKTGQVQRCKLSWLSLPIGCSRRVWFKQLLRPFNMPPKSKAIAELGYIMEDRGAFRAQVNHGDATGRKQSIVGPKRGCRRRAETDLDQMRAAGAIGSTREQGLQYMAAEARRLQVSAGFEAEVRAAAQRQRAAEEEEDEVYMSDEEPEEDDPWMLDYPSPHTDDVTAPTPPSQKPPLTREEADVALQAFRPIKARPEDLAHILACRADPNRPLTVPGDISPLQKVLCFARAAHVAKMRELLLERDADETEEDRKDWVTRQRADFRESIRIRESREDMLAYDPCGAAMERNM